MYSRHSVFAERESKRKQIRISCAGPLSVLTVTQNVSPHVWARLVDAQCRKKDILNIDCGDHYMSPWGTDNIRRMSYGCISLADLKGRIVEIAGRAGILINTDLDRDEEAGFIDLRRSSSPDPKRFCVYENILEVSSGSLPHTLDAFSEYFGMAITDDHAWCMPRPAYIFKGTEMIIGMRFEVFDSPVRSKSPGLRFRYAYVDLTE